MSFPYPGIRSLWRSGTKILARITHRRIEAYRSSPLQYQQRFFRRLVQVLPRTAYGRALGISAVPGTVKEFQQKVPLTTYEDLLPYIQRIQQGERDVLWRGLPVYFAKTSGTTAGTKWIPMSRETVHNQLKAARECVFHYIYRTKQWDLLIGKLLFLSGSPEVERAGVIPAGRLSGIAHRIVPGWLRKNRLPSWEVNIIPVWEEKLHAVVQEALQHAENLTLISGIPPWIQMFLEWVEQAVNKPPYEVFPNLKVYVHGGVQFRPYRIALRTLLGPRVDFVETYPASEGFFAFQDENESPEGEHPGLLLLPDHGVFYEFIPVEEVDRSRPGRLTLEEVQPHHRYELVVSTDGGLWAYRMGDLVEFVSVRPWRIRVVGRTRMTLSPFGEHVIVEEIERALEYALQETGAMVREFTVSVIHTTRRETELPRHIWLIEFQHPPEDLRRFGDILDSRLQDLNPYYRDLRKGKIIDAPEVHMLVPGTFQHYLQSTGRIGEQYKVPRVDPEGKHVPGLLEVHSRLKSSVSYPEGNRPESR